MQAPHESSSSGAATSSKRRLIIASVVFALVYPSIITWGYFVLAERYSTGIQQTVYLIVKTVQFAFPICWVWLVLREPVRTGRATAKGLALGAAFSIVVIAAGWFIFRMYLRDLPIFANATALIHEKIAGFGIDSLWKYVLLAAFYSIFHSLLEEYYWRWFVFRQLRRLTPLWVAIVISSLGFMAHHVIVLYQFFEGAPLLAWLLSSAVAVGGAFWAWLYERTNSLYGPWLSHLLIDAGIFLIGYDLLRESILR